MLLGPAALAKKTKPIFSENVNADIAAKGAVISGAYPRFYHDHQKVNDREQEPDFYRKQGIWRERTRIRSLFRDPDGSFFFTFSRSLYRDSRKKFLPPAPGPSRTGAGARRSQRRSEKINIEKYGH